MGLAVRRHQAGPVNGKENLDLQQFHIVDDLVISPLQEGGVNGCHRDHPLAGKAGRKGDLMLFRHAHIKEAVRIRMAKELQPGAILHGCGDGADFGVGCGRFAQSLSENGGEGCRCSHLGVRNDARFGSGNAMVFTRVFFRRLVALPFCGDHMEEKRP